MGQLVAELRKVYVTAKAEAAPILEDILGEGSVQSLDRETTETEAVGEGRNLIIFLLFIKVHIFWKRNTLFKGGGLRADICNEFYWAIELSCRRIRGRGGGGDSLCVRNLQG